MNAIEAAKISQAAIKLVEMPLIYKQIREAAETGKRSLFLSKRDVEKIQIEVLKEKGYKVTEEWSETKGSSSDILEGYNLQW